MKKSYSKILSIKPAGKSKVYDFTVKDTHRILANNFYTSNCHINHPDIAKFITMKDDVTKITGANISVKVTDEFMKAVENNTDYILKWPTEDKQPVIIEQIVYNKLYKRDDGSYIMKVKARELWDLIVRQAHKTAEPGVLFWDNIIKESPADCYQDVGFETLGTNPCVVGDTLVLTTLGWIKIKNLKKYKNIGILTQNKNGEKTISVCEWSGVTKKEDTIYKITFNDNSYCKVNDKHKFYDVDFNGIIAIESKNKEILSYRKTLKIIGIEELTEKEDVYDLTANPNYNFFMKYGGEEFIQKNFITHGGKINYEYDKLNEDYVLSWDCGEVPLSSHDSCRLGSINLNNIVDKPYTENAKVNFKLLAKVARVAQRLMDDIVSLEEEKIRDIIEKINSDPESIEIKETELKLWKKVLDVLLKGRRTGVGVLGLGDMLAKLNIKYGSEEATTLINEVFKTIAVNSYRESVQLAKERGSFPVWDVDKESQNPFINRVISNNFTNEEYNDYLKYGRRNIANLSIAPTGSLALLAKTTSGIEPVFKIYYKRRRKINENEEGVRVDFKDESGDAWQEYNVFHNEFIKWAKIKGYTINGMSDIEIDELVKISPWNEAESHNIDYSEKVVMQGVIQKWIDHSISVTHNLPQNISIEEVNKIYFNAWKAGCKGCTIYREGSRSGVLITNTKKEDDFKISNAPKRPKELKADYYVTTANGIKFAVIIGLWKDTNTPYEIFAFENPPMDKNTDGRIIKVKKGHYKFVNHDFVIEDIQLAAERVEQRAHTIFLSMLLRHGAPITHIINVAKKVDENISSFSSACRRVLSRYVEPENLDEKCPSCGSKMIREEGCVHCTQCSYSRC